MTEATLAPRLGEAPEATLARLRRVVGLSVALNAVPDTRRLLAAVLDTVTASLGCEQAALLLDDGLPDGSLRFAAATGDNRAALADIPVPLHGSLAGACLRENRVVYAAEAAADGRHFDRAAQSAGVHVRALLAVPMRVDGRPVGVVQALNPAVGGFDAADAETLLVISAQAAVAVRNARQQAALRHAAARVAALDQARADFVAVASHELRTPLAAVQGYAQSLAEDVPADLRPVVNEVLGAARHMGAIVETLDELSALRDEAAQIATEPVDVRAVVTDSAAEAPREVDVERPEAPVRVLGDARRLRLAFGRLLANSDAFTPPEGRVWIEVEPGDGAVAVRVCDTGVGIAEADLERVFEPFVQVQRPDTRTHEGLGVGLALARSVVLRHGGQIWATSAGAGRGTVVHVRLPLAE